MRISAVYSEIGPWKSGSLCNKMSKQTLAWTSENMSTFKHWSRGLEKPDADLDQFLGCANSLASTSSNFESQIVIQSAAFSWSKYFSIQEETKWPNCKRRMRSGHAQTYVAGYCDWCWTINDVTHLIGSFNSVRIPITRQNWIPSILYGEMLHYTTK